MGKGPRTITPCDNVRELKTESVLYTYTCMEPSHWFPMRTYIAKSFQLSRN